MARPATKRRFLDPHRLTLDRVWRLLRDPAPGRLAYSIRIAAACTTVVLVGEIWQVPDLAVPALVTLILWQQDRVTNALAGLALNILIVLLLALVYGLVRLTLDHPMGIAIIVALLSFGFFFLGSASKLKPVSYMLGLIVVYGLIAIDQVPVGEVITRALLYTDLFLAVPGAVMIVLGLLICPSPKTLLTRRIAARLRMTIDLLHYRDQPTRERAADMLRAGVKSMLSNVKMAGLEKVWSRHDLAALTQAAYASVGTLSLAEAAVRRQEAAPDDLIATLSDMAAIFESGDYPAHITRPPVPADSAALAAMASLLPGFTTPPETAAPQEKGKSGFFFPDAFTNPDHVRFAVKGTAAVMTAYFLFKILDWQGIHTMIITCFIVALPTMGEMIAKLTLRIVGALIGGAIGIAAIIGVMPHLNDITGFLVLIFVVSLFAAWIKTGDARISYAGFQIGLAFFLTDLKGYGPTTDMATARDRIVGILLGNFLTYAMFTSFWPASAYDHVGEKLRTIAKALAAQRESKTVQERLIRAASVQAALSEGERTLEYAAAEPVHMRADAQQLATFRAALDDAARLSDDLLLAHDDMDIDRRMIRLDHVAA